MNLRFHCFEWNNWNRICVTTPIGCNTSDSLETDAESASLSGYTFCNTGTRGYEKSCPRGAAVCACEHSAARALARIMRAGGHPQALGVSR